MVGDGSTGFLDQAVFIGEQFPSIHVEFIDNNILNLVVVVAVPVGAGDAQVFVIFCWKIVHIVRYSQDVQRLSSPQHRRRQYPCE